MSKAISKDKTSKPFCWSEIKDDLPIQNYQEEHIYFPGLPFYQSDYVIWNAVTQQPTFVYLDHKIGQGTFGSCYIISTSDKNDDSHSAEESDTAIAKIIEVATPVQQKRWDSELKIHSSLNHPNIIEFFGCMQFATEGVLLLEYASHGSLKKLFNYALSHHKRIGEVKIRTIALHVAQGLEYLHRCKIVHSDINLNNIVMGENGTCKIIDFGLSQFWSDGKPPLTKLTGTPRYVAPEMLKKNYTNKIDLWSFGVVLYCLIEKKKLFPVKDRKDIFKMIRRSTLPTYFIRPTSSFLEKLVLDQLLIRDPNKRLTAKQCMELLKATHAT